MFSLKKHQKQSGLLIARLRSGHASLKNKYTNQNYQISLIC